MQNKWLNGLSLLLVSASVSTTVVAQQDTSNLSDRERIERLERLVEGQGLVDLVMRLDSLQREIQQLRGDTEVNTRSLEEIKKRQRDLYIDIDRRLLQLERRSAGSAPVAPASSVPTTSAPVTSQPQVTRPAAQPSTSPADDLTEQQAYQQAFDLLRELRYDKAMAAFRAFIDKYPDGRYAHIAQYWLGEAGYAQSQFATAIKDYQVLLDNYPNSPKRAQAMLKIGYSHYKLKNMKQAQQVFNQVLKTYPGTTEAGQAEKMLKEIKINRN
ncbi:MAG: tol-pal system protein YbgF [Thioalkalispiraceae bacterium]|jgi:tol-pal system protein YbgF